MLLKTLLALFITALFALNSTNITHKNSQNPTDGNGDWGDYLGGADRNHYSELTQITPENVANLGQFGVVISVRAA